MENFVAYAKEYWQYLIALVVVIVVFVFVVSKAAKAYKRHYTEIKAETKELERLKALKEKYKGIPYEVIASAPDEEILEGVALTYQLALQKEEDMEKAFSLYNIEKQYAYALDIFCSSKKASDFFRENGEQLTELFMPGLEYIGFTQEIERLKKLSLMLDEKDETYSFSAEFAEETDKLVAEKGIMAAIRVSFAEMIKKEYEKFSIQSLT